MPRMLLHRVMPTAATNNVIGPLTTAGLALMVMGLVCPSAAQAQSNTRFSDLVGVNGKTSLKRNLLENVIGNGRTSDLIEWDYIEPTANGGYRDDRIDQFINKYTKGNANRLETTATALPIFEDSPSWAEDKSTKTWQFQGKTFSITRNNDGSLKYSGNVEADLDTHPGSTFFRPPSLDHVQDWKNYVSHTTQRILSKTPQRVKDAGGDYFQIWNEASSNAPFYIGDLDLKESESDASGPNDDGYFTRIHKPAADAIHDAGGNVVYGGWPSSNNPLTDYADWLDYHDAWDTIDATSFHYRRLTGVETIRQRAIEAGHPDIGIWQTEEGRDKDGYVPSYYSRFAHWAIEHNDGDPNRYRAYQFPYAFKGSIKSKFLIVEQQKNGEAVNVLTRHGLALQALGDLLGGGELNNYDGVTNDKNIGFSLDRRDNSQEAFKVNDNIVVALHLHDDVPESESITLEFSEIDKEDVESALRANPYGAGDGIDLMDAIEELEDGGISIEVPTGDIFQPKDSQLHANGPTPRSFYVDLGLVPEPTSAALLGLGFFGLLASGRGRGRSHHGSASRHGNVGQ